ncbi:MAG: nucleotide exchange factor GrpE [Candidatus Paceibacterota bacterium]|jgi:molecular chaperone GrpE
MDIQDKNSIPEEQSSVPEPEINEKIQTKEEEYLDGWKRAKAELLNYKKDEAKRFESIIRFSNESLVKELLSVLDSFDLAENSFGEDAKAQKGFYLIKSQLEDVLKRNGVEKIKIEIGETFNPEFHEAVANVDSDQPTDSIIEEIESGYILNGKIIRPARVKVSKGH